MCKPPISYSESYSSLLKYLLLYLFSACILEQKWRLSILAFEKLVPQ